MEIESRVLIRQNDDAGRDSLEATRCSRSKKILNLNLKLLGKPVTVELDQDY